MSKKSFTIFSHFRLQKAELLKEKFETNSRPEVSAENAFINRCFARGIIEAFASGDAKVLERHLKESGLPTLLANFE